MDDILTEFISQTGADPALAHDILEGYQWSLPDALVAYESFKSTKSVQSMTDFDYPSLLATSDDRVMAGEPPPPNPGSPSSVEDLLHSLAIGPSPVALGGREEEDEEVAELDASTAMRKNQLKKQREKRGRGLSIVAEDVVDDFRKVAVSKQRISSTMEEQEVIDDLFFRHSFVYPNFCEETPDMQEFIRSDLLETSHLRALEKTGRLNWWTATGRLPRLEPLATSGDGNCLLHAASLYMWGFHDRELILRTALHRLLTAGVEKEGVWRRWKHQTGLRNKEAGGLTFSDDEWAFEWAEIVRIATSKPRREPVTDSLRRYSSLRLSYEYLEEVHIFALAHVIRRPVVVISDRVLRNFDGEDIAPIHFGGIYLPLEVSPSQCFKSPMVLAYDSAHFSALVAKEEKSSESKASQSKFGRMSGRTDIVIPLVTPDGALLPIQFIGDPENKAVDEKWAKGEFTPGEFPPTIVQLLESYLDVRWIKLNISPSQERRSPSPPAATTDGDDYDHLWPGSVPKVRFPAANITIAAQPVYQKDLVDKYLQHIRVKFEEDRERRRKLAEARKREEEEKRLRQPVPCRGAGCGMFGTLATDGLCSMCFQKLTVCAPTSNGGTSGTTSPLSSPSEDSADYPPPYDLAVVEPDRHRQEPYKFNPASVGKLDRQQRAPPTLAGLGLQPAPPPSVNAELDSAPPTSASSELQPAPPPSASSGLRPAPPPSGLQPSLAGKPLSAQSGGVASNSPTEQTGGASDKGPKQPPLASPSKKGPKPPGWMKKIPVLDRLVPKNRRTSNGNAGNSSSGYMRDGIQPIKFESGDTVVAGTQRPQCRKAGCSFYGDTETEGYCSTCFKSLGLSTPAAQVTYV